jgi:hypothetical protein
MTGDVNSSSTNKMETNAAKLESEKSTFSSYLNRFQEFNSGLTAVAVRGITTLKHGYVFAIDEYNYIKHVVHNLAPMAIHNQLLNVSENVNQSYQYTSMLVRSHSDSFKMLSVASLSLPTLYYSRRLFVYTDLSTFIFSSVAVEIVQYKWKISKSNE